MWSDNYHAPPSCSGSPPQEWPGATDPKPLCHLCSCFSIYSLGHADRSQASSDSYDVSAWLWIAATDFLRISRKWQPTGQRSGRDRAHCWHPWNLQNPVGLGQHSHVSWRALERSSGNDFSPSISGKHKSCQSSSYFPWSLADLLVKLTLLHSHLGRYLPWPSRNELTPDNTTL